MATSSKRYGLEVKGDLELELRLRRIEGRLDAVIGASDFGASEDTQRLSTIPLVTGLRVKGRTPGSVTVSWNQLRLTNLRRYELEFATNLAFSENKQAFNVAGTEFNFTTVEQAGGGGGQQVYARVRARVTSGSFGSFSVVLNTSTGQAQTADIADEAVTEEQIADGVGSLPPTVAPGNSLQFVRANSGGTALEYAYQFPSFPASNKAMIGNGTNVVQTAYTFPAAIVANQLLTGSGTNIGQTSWTVPSALTSTGKMLRVSSSNVLSETNWNMPATATIDNAIVGDGTNFVLVDQNPSTSTVSLAGGLTLTYGIESITNGGTASPAFTGTFLNVTASLAEQPAGTPAEAAVSASESGGTVTLEQNNTNGDELDVSYLIISET
jgi:hypothetical protein